MTRRRILLFVLATLTLLLPLVAHAAPVDLLEQDVQAFVQDNGAMDVIYRLTFRDNEGRGFIRKVGEFYQPARFTRSWIIDGEAKHEASVQALGGGYYRVNFGGGFRTRAGGTYTVELHYRNNHRFADPTTADGKALIAVWFNPVRWVLPIQKSVVKLVLPLELPEGVQQHEEISPEMVDGLGVVTERRSLKAQAHWAFVYTDYRDQRRLTLYAEQRSLRPEATHLIKLFIPAAAMPGLSSGTDVEAAGAAEHERLESSGEVVLREETYRLAVGGGAIALIARFPAARPRASRRRARPASDSKWSTASRPPSAA